MRPTTPRGRRQYPRRASATRARLAIEPLEDRITPITNGVLDGIGHPNVGAFEAIRAPTDLPDLEVPRVIGSGTLIHPRVFLTAGHVTAAVEQRLADGTAKLDDLRVSFGPDAFDERSWLAISGVITHPGFRDIHISAGAQVGNDIGVVILQQPVENITPATLAPLGFLDALKDAGLLQAGPDATSFTVVGYGSQLDVPPPEVVPPDGLRRVAQSAYRSLQQDWLTVSQQFATGLGGTGYGDSGGPTFWVDPATGREILVSLTSRGDIPLVSNGVTYRVDISPSLDFINSVIAQVESGSGGGALLASGIAPASVTAGSDVPGELLIRFQPGVSTADIAAFYADHGLAELNNFDFGHDLDVKLVATPTLLARDLVPALQQDPRVRYAEPNFVVTPAQVPNDPALPRDWGLSNTGQTGGAPDADIDADEAWGVTTGSSRIIVAVIDTGVDYTHPDLAANMCRNPGEIADNGLDDDGNGYVDDVHGYDFVNEDSDPMDDPGHAFSGHGTHIAGTIGMVGNNAVGATGINWDVQIMALRTDGGSGHSGADLLQAYSYVTMMRHRGVDIRVTNNSYGGFNPFVQVWKDAIDAMGQAGMLFVTSAGNQSVDIDTSIGGRRVYPASFDSPHIISVAATDHSDRYALFTNWGATSVDLAAPGEAVWSTLPGGAYGWASGTSMAAPHVAGAAALVWSAYPDHNNAEVKARLLGGVDPIGHIGANAARPTLTNGRLNVRNALLVPAPDEGDTTAPAAVGDLAVAAASPWSVTLTWTATGDDGATGRAGFYDVRYSTSRITEANWTAASRAAAEPAPGFAGSSERFTVTGLEPGAFYYFAVKVRDNPGNESALSSLTHGSTAAATFLLNDGAEGGADNWTATGLWHRSGLRAYDSATAWYYGREDTRTYATGASNSGALTLAAPLDLTGVSQALLRFREFRQPAYLPGPSELALVQVSRDGADWVTAIEAIYPTQVGWEQRAVDLTPFVGGPVYLRFVFDTNDAGVPPDFLINDFEGWYVDDVQVLVPGEQPAGLSINDVTVTEGHDRTVRATFTVTRSDTRGHLSVDYATADGSATAAGGDYRSDSGRLTFLPGEERQTITVLVNGDLLGEEDESFFVRLSNALGANAVIADGEGKAAIVDDEPRVFLRTPFVTGEGGSSGTRPIVLQAFLSALSSQPVTVRYATADGTATAGADYVAADNMLTFNPGETFKTFSLALVRDTVPEPNEMFFVNLTPVSSNVVIMRQGVVYVGDDDLPPASSGTSGGALAPASVASLSLAGWSGSAAGIPSIEMIRSTSTGVTWLEAAAWGWFPTATGPGDDSEFTTPGNHGEQNRMDLLGHESEGLMAETLADGTRLTPGGLAAADEVFASDMLLELWAFDLPFPKRTT